MIEKLYESYDDNNYYIDTNKKKLAHDNAGVISGLLTFFAIVGVIFVAVAMAFGSSKTLFYVYARAMVVLLVLLLLNSLASKRLIYDFGKIRIYAFFIYPILILSFSFADVSTFR